MLAEGYTVRLDAFSGPLDLLVHLIRRAEVDISVISVSQITDQYLESISHVSDIDIDVAGEFLVIAATLIEIKSRQLAPAEDDDSAQASLVPTRREPEDPAADLVRQLLAYRSFRNAADRLTERRAEWDKRFPLRRLAMAKGVEAPVNDDLELDDLNLHDLVESYSRIAQSVAFDRLGDHTIEEDDTPIELHATDVLDRLRRLHAPDGGDRTMPLRAIFADHGRSDVIGLFLAVLELVRQRSVAVAFDGHEVMLRLIDDERADASLQAQRAWDDDDVLEDADDDDEDDDSTP